MVIGLEQEDFYDGNGRQHKSIETVQCRLCGAINRTAIDVVAQHWVNFGCPACQTKVHRTFVSIMERAGFTDESVNNILMNGLNNA